MTEEVNQTSIADSSFVFRFDTNEYFTEDVNLATAFTIAGMKNNGEVYNIILLGKCPDNIYQSSVMDTNTRCLNNTNGSINYTSGVFEKINFDYQSPEIYLQHTHNQSTGGYDVTVIGNNIKVDVGATSQVLKAVMVVNATTKYVLAYSILNDSILVSGQVNIPIEGALSSVIKYTG